MDKEAQERKVVEMLKQQNKTLRKEVKALQQEVLNNVVKKPKPKTGIDNATNYEKMIANANKVLKQTIRDKEVYVKRLAKHDNENKADELRSDIIRYKEEISELKKNNLQMKMRQLDHSKDLINDMLPAQRYAGMKEELKFYNGKNSEIQERLARCSRSLSVQTELISEIETKVAKMPPIDKSMRESDTAEIRLAQKNVMQSLQRDYNVLSRSMRSVSNRYRRKIYDIEQSLKGVKSMERSLLNKINGRLEKNKRARSTMAYYDRKMLLPSRRSPSMGHGNPNLSQTSKNPHY